MKHIIFGGFDYAVLYEMDQNAILNGIDYFVDTDEKRIGTTYLGKPIKPLTALEEENPEEIMILIGSIVYRTELEMHLKAMGFEADKHYMWAIAFTGDEKCSRLWAHTEWSDKEKNAENLKAVAESEYCLQRFRVAESMVNWEEYDTVVDLGAANERLAEVIPQDIKYVPVDYIKYTERTVLCDINKYEFPEKQYFMGKTVVFSIANIQYCHDWKWYLRKLAESSDCIVLEHSDFARIAREYRRANWTRYNALFDHEIIGYMQKLGFVLADSKDFRLRSTIYKFVKRER